MSTGINIAPSSDITVGTTAVTSGTDTRVFFQAGGVVQQDANFTFDNTLKRLTLKAVGTAATDIPFAVQNSGGTRNNLTVNGAGLTTSNIDAPASYVWTNHFQAVRFESGSPITNVNIKTNYPFVESFYIGRSTGTANNDASTASGFMYSHNGEFTVRNGQTGGYYGITLNCEQNLEQRVGIDTGRTGFGLGWSLRNFTNSVDVINFATNSPRVGIGWNNKGAALGAILDVKAQGALSTDIAFRVRNSADTQNIVSFNGDGRFLIGQNASNTCIGGVPQYAIAIGASAAVSGASETYGSPIAIGYDAQSVGTSALAIGNSTRPNTGIAIGHGVQSRAEGVAIGGSTTNARGTVMGSGSSNSGYGGSSIGYDVDNTGDGSFLIGYFHSNSIASSFVWGSNGIKFWVNSNSNLVLANNKAITDANKATYVDTSATNTFTIHSGTAPVANITDAYQQYSADITAGNAAPHFRTENGAIVKVYQETTAVAASTLVGNAGTAITDTDTFDGYTLKQIVKALRNQGLLA